tara:strand:+ start:79378 stop:80514 length:1137 start_codon:yes stop_codon:yes gene_type:complete
MQPKIKMLLGLLSTALLVMSTQASAAWELNMPIGITDISRATYDLHMLITIICALIGVVVYGVLIYSLIKYRKSKGAKSASFHENTTIEIVWTIIPILILVAMAIPSTGVLREIYDASESELDVMITGYQWRWQYSYLDDEGEEVSFFSNLATTDDQIAGLDEKSENYLLEVDQPLVIPVDTKVRFLLTAADVIHSWWVPDFAVKKDAVPGFINESWVIANETGTFRGQCTELCGQDHGFMPVVVEVVEKAEFEAWYSERQAQAAAVAELANQDWSLEQLVAQGETVYRTFCMACHQQNGQGLPPAFPALTGSAIATGPIEDHVNVVINGVAGTAMAAFGAQLSPVDIAAVVTYERNALGNSVGDFITPVEILQAQAE